MADLPTNYLDDILSDSMGGKRRFKITHLNGTSEEVTIEDISKYDQVGSTFGAGDLHKTNQAVNEKFDSDDVVDPMLTTEPGFAADAYQTKLQFDAQNKNFEKIHNYSTEETVIGKWVDGKTIYRRHFSGNLISNGTYNTLFNENVNVINAIGSVIRASDGAHTVVGQQDTHIWNAINTPEVFLVVTDSFKGGRYDIVVEYTKN